ncbi:unnamed protein product [Camellia sinensis]
MTQAHIRELEEEVKLFKNLSHLNIVRYLGTTKEEESLNILMEIVLSGSISSLLGKFGYKNVHKIVVVGSGIPSQRWNNAPGPNILVDDKECIKLADFDASKKVVELATMTGAKSMKGTLYLMAPEVILQTRHSFSADIWSVKCTVIEMAIGKPTWNQQYQKGTKLKACCIRFAAVQKILEKKMATPKMELKNLTTYTRLKDVHNSVRCSTIYPEKFPGSVQHWESGNCDDDMCQIDDEDDLVIGASTKFNFALLSDDFNKAEPSLRPVASDLLQHPFVTKECAVIEMATGKPPWSQQYQEVVALFHIGTTKSHPSILEHLSAEAIDFLLKCLQKEPNLRPTASDLLIHLLLGSIRKPILCYALKLWLENSGKKLTTPEMELKNSMDAVIRTTYTRLKEVHNSVRCSTIYLKKFPGSVPHWGLDNCDDDTCQIDDEDDLVIGASAKFDFALLSADFNKIIEMATRKPPWSQQYQEVAALFHIGTTKSHPPIPEHLSAEEIDFLLKYLQKYEPNLRPVASYLLQLCRKILEKKMATPEMELKNSTTYTQLKNVYNNVSCLTIYLEKFPRSVPHWGLGNCDDDMCQIDDEDDLVIGALTKFDFALLSDDFNKSFNPISEPVDIWSVGCTVIEMATRKPPWSQQYQEKEPNLMAAALDLLQENSEKKMATPEMELKNSMDPKFPGSVSHWGSSNCDDDMCQIDGEDDFVIGASTKFVFALLSDDFNKSFNPMSEPADIWNVGCMVIEMASEKPFWSQQYQEVAALFYIGTTKSHPPIPMYLSAEAIDFLLKCLKKEPNLRPVVSDLLQHPFVAKEYQETYHVLHASIVENSRKKMATPEIELKNSITYTRLKDIHNSVSCLTIYLEKFPRSVLHWGSSNCDDDTCQIDDEDDLVIGASTKFDFALLSVDFNKLLRWLHESLLGASSIRRLLLSSMFGMAFGWVGRRFGVRFGRRLEWGDIPLDQLFLLIFGIAEDCEVMMGAVRLGQGQECVWNPNNSGTYFQCVSNIGTESVQTLSQVQPPKPSEWKEVVRDDKELINPRKKSFMKSLKGNEIMRRATVVKTLSPKDRIVNRQKNQSKFASSRA